MKYDDNRKATAQVIKQRLQADSGNPVSVYNGPVHCARLTIKREGLRGLYTGILLALPTTYVHSRCHIRISLESFEIDLYLVMRMSH